MADKIALMLKDMEEEHKHAEIFKSMVFPDTKKMKEKRTHAIVKCEYSCENEICDFSSCLVDIAKDPRLLKYRSKDVCTALVENIAKHQEDYLPAQVDGFFINRMGHELVHLKRVDCDDKGVTGFVEFNDLRKQSMDYYDQQKLKAIKFVMDEATAKDKTCVIM